MCTISLLAVESHKKVLLNIAPNWDHSSSNAKLFSSLNRFEYTDISNV